MKKLKDRDYPEWATRLYTLIKKLESIKGVIFIIATILIFIGKITFWPWFLSGILVVSIRMFEKMFFAIFPIGVKKISPGGE